MKTQRTLGRIGALWAVTGFSALLLFAIVRLTAISLDSLKFPLSWYHWPAGLFSLVVMAYSEGYKGFQCKFSPRFAARCKYLYTNPAPLHVLLAPLFCMGFFHTTRARKITTIAISLMILVFVKIAHALPHPWRGILDIGVVTGLIWGLASLYYFLYQAFTTVSFQHSAELPIDH